MESIRASQLLSKLNVVYVEWEDGDIEAEEARQKVWELVCDYQEVNGTKETPLTGVVSYEPLHVGGYATYIDDIMLTGEWGQ